MAKGLGITMGPNNKILFTITYLENIYQGGISGNEKLEDFDFKDWRKKDLLLEAQNTFIKEFSSRFNKQVKILERSDMGKY